MLPTWRPESWVFSLVMRKAGLSTSFGHQLITDKRQNKALHWTGIPLRSIPASELQRWAAGAACSRADGSSGDGAWKMARKIKTTQNQPRRGGSI